MKRKILLGLCLIAVLFSFTACGSSKDKEESNRESKKYQEGFVEGKYSIKDLTYNIPDGFEVQENNRYALNDGTNGIMVEFYVKSNFEGTLDEYIAMDENYFYPDSKSLTDTKINGNNWLKGSTTDGGIIYYIKDGDSIYSFMISPLYTTKGFLNGVVSTIESSLYFK